MTENVINVGEYIIIQKQNYKKLHKLNKPNSVVNIGKDAVNLSGIIGNQYFSVFKMVFRGTKKTREYDLQVVDEAITLKNEIQSKTSGADNRNIYDDGRSQKLSAEEINDLKSDSNTASEIVETLITNSNTFHNKTEFSQEKYLKKKEKKYFEYIQILRPNLRHISEVMYKLEPTKIQGIRLDTLSQIITLSNVSSEGNHLLYDSGSNGLLAAALLSAIGKEGNGKLVHMHPGNMSQKQALLAMNFDVEQMNKCISVNVYSVLRQIYQGTDTNDQTTPSESVVNPLKRKALDSLEHNSKVPKQDNECNSENNLESETNKEDDETTKQEYPSPKKPKWHFDNIAASEVLLGKLDSLVIACKEDPENIFLELLPFIKPGRPFVIYNNVVEPLQNMYITLKSLGNIAALKVTCNWMRNYQILPERTHPDVMMNNASGFLLTGYILK